MSGAVENCDHTPVDLDLTVITTEEGRFVVLGEVTIQKRDCLALVHEESFLDGMAALTKGASVPGFPEIRWREKRGDELVPLPAAQANLATRLLSMEMVEWAKGKNP